MEQSKIFEKLKNLLFIDIETASLSASLEGLPEGLQPLWAKKGLRLEPEMSAEESFQKWAAIFAEFGKAIAIGMGYFYEEEGEELPHFRVTALDHEEEGELLQAFHGMLQGKKRLRLVAHNGLDFDFPFLGRRMVVQRIPLPESLDLMAKRPWEIKHIDTLQMWKFGEFRHFTSLELLCQLLGIPSSKEDLDGSQVSRVYHEEGDLPRIVRYCQADVVATARLYLRFNGFPDLEDERIHHVEMM